MVTQVTKYDLGMIYVIVMVTQSCNTEKNIEGSRTDDII